MKKIYTVLLLFALVTGYSAHAQIKAPGFKPVYSNLVISYPKGALASPFTVDTLTPPVFMSPCFTSSTTPFTVYSWSAPAKGFVTGNNLIQTGVASTACAQRYSYTGTGDVKEVLVGYGYKTGSTGVTSVKIYSVNPTTKKPATLLGTSTTIATGSISTTGITSYTFTTPAQVTGDFFASVVLPSATAGDTTAIASTKIGCNSADSLSYTNLTGAGWYNYVDILDAKNPGDTTLDLYILPVVTVTTGINEYPSSNGLTLMGAYPNPAKDLTNIQYHIETPAIVSVEIFDLAGRVIQHSSEKLNAGTHDIKISLKDISSGNNYYTIKTEEI